MSNPLSKKFLHIREAKRAADFVEVERARILDTVHKTLDLDLEHDVQELIARSLEKWLDPVNATVMASNLSTDILRLFQQAIDDVTDGCTKSIERSASNLLVSLSDALESQERMLTRKAAS